MFARDRAQSDEASQVALGVQVRQALVVQVKGARVDVARTKGVEEGCDGGRSGLEKLLLIGEVESKSNK